MRMIWSAIRKKIEAIATMTNTMAVVIAVSRRVGQVTFWPSARTSCRNLNGLIFAMTYLIAGNGLGCKLLTFPDFLNRARLRLAGVEGLEPPTPGFGDRCSSH